jgi:heme A synthase
MTAAEALLAVMVVQAVVGYVQYFNALPPLLVGFHVAGAVLVYGAVHQLQLELRVRVASSESLATVAAPGTSVGGSWLPVQSSTRGHAST